jgi:ATP-dependent phosphoenolpyruvate carboxykinase
VSRHPRWSSQCAGLTRGADTFEINRERAIDYLNTRDHVYVFDGVAGWDPKYRSKVRVVCARAYHALFMVSLGLPLSQTSAR